MVDTEVASRILAAAYTCFTRSGVRSTTMDDIASRAEVSRPTVYNHVGSKDVVFRQVLEVLLNEALEAARISARRPAALQDRILKVVECKLAVSARIRADSPEHATDFIGVDAALSRDLIRQFDSRLAEILAHEIGLDYPAANDRDIAEILLVVCRGFEAELLDNVVFARRLYRTVELIVAGLASDNGDRT
ncbi:TetR/AcrR family transcriptional regulator [Streptomyces sp. NPDC127036]|uniref:TetR/AcrR family transcriptional regulator n=1 Tax=Streptomyces sp. NPDC127036 TaxID=3347112 RepID=UPI003653DA9F